MRFRRAAAAAAVLALLAGCVLSDASSRAVEQAAGVRASQVPAYRLVTDVEVTGPRTEGPQELRVEMEGVSQAWAHARVSLGGVVLGQVLLTRGDSVRLWLRPPGGRATVYRGTSAELARALCPRAGSGGEWLCLASSLPRVMLEPERSAGDRSLIRVRAAGSQPEMEIAVVRAEGVVREMTIRTVGTPCALRAAVTFSRRTVAQGSVRVPAGSTGALRAGNGTVLGRMDTRVRRFEVSARRPVPVYGPALNGTWARLMRDPVVEEFLRRGTAPPGCR